MPNEFEASEKVSGPQDDQLVTYDGLNLALEEGKCKPGAIFKNCTITWYNHCGSHSGDAETTLCDDAIFIDCDFKGTQSWNPNRYYDSNGREICDNDSFGHSLQPLTFGKNCVFNNCKFDPSIPYTGLDADTNLFDKCSGHANSPAPNETKGGDINWTGTECEGSEIDLIGGATKYRYTESTPTINA